MLGRNNSIISLFVVILYDLNYYKLHIESIYMNIYIYIITVYCNSMIIFIQCLGSYFLPFKDMCR